MKLADALARLRRKARGIAAASVVLYALNALGLALMPCTMAFAADTSMTAGEPCAHCPPAAHHAGNDGACAAVAKPALDARDAKSGPAPLVIALASPTLHVAVATGERGGFAALDPSPPAGPPPLQRYCRRLE